MSNQDTKDKIIEIYNKNKVPFYSTIIVGLLTYMFLITNKIPCYDDIRYFLGKGGTINHGRWGLEIMELLMPSISVPWFYGVLSIVFVAIGNCFAVETFDIKNKIVQSSLCGAIVAFPILIDMMLYMFMASSWTLAYAFTAAGVFFLKKYKKGYIVSTVLAVLAISIYQAFATVFSSLLVVLLIKRILESDKKEIKNTILLAAKMAFAVVSSLVLYYAITKIIWAIDKTELHSYAEKVAENVGSESLIHNIKRTWLNFVDIFTVRKYGIQVNYLSSKIHEVCGALTIISLIIYMVKSKEWIKLGLISILITIILPISICGMILYFGEAGVNSRVFFSFISVYVLAGIVAEKTNIKIMVSSLLGAVVVINIYFANVVYLRQFLNYESSKARIETILSTVFNNPEYSEECKIAFIGEPSWPVYAQYLDNYAVSGSISLTCFSEIEEFTRLYLGFSGEFASFSERLELEENEEVIQMPCFPYYGSIQRIGDYIVVKLNNQS